MIREGKADFTSVKHFRHFFGTARWVVVVVVVVEFFFWREKDEWRQLMDITEKRAII